VAEIEENEVKALNNKSADNNSVFSLDANVTSASRFRRAERITMSLLSD